MNSATRFRKSTLHSAVVFALSINGAALALSAGNAQASESACGTYTPLSPNNSINFTMLAANGGVVGGTNDVLMAWDGKAYDASTDYTGPGVAANVTMSSTTPFFGHAWTAHDIQVFAPGSYSFDVTAGGGNPETGTLNATVNAGQLGMHMLFDWNGNNNIDVFIVLSQNSVFGSGLLYSTQTNTAGKFKCDSSFTGTIVKNCLYDGSNYGNAGAPTNSKKWMLASVDGNGDGIMGIPMATGGPFAGFNANFNFLGTLSLTANTPCSPATADQFTFTPVTGATPNTVYTASAVFQLPGGGTSATVAGLGTGVTASISVAGGEYSKNGGAWTNVNGTVQDGDAVQVRQTSSANSDGTTTTASLSIGGTSGTFSVTVIDEKPDAFSFTTQTGVATSTTVTSNTITVSGMDTGLTTPISISGGEYSVNGAAYSTTTPSTVQDGNTITVRQTSSATGAATSIATLTLGALSNGTQVSGTFTITTAGGVSSTGNNFTMLDQSGNVTGGTNDVSMTWDQQFNTSASDPVTPTTAHMTLSSPTPFFGFPWTAHHIRVFGPGTYVINTTCTTTQLETGACTASSISAQNYTFTVGANQIGAHMLFDWNGTLNIDVVEVWNKTAVFAPSPLYTGPVGFNAASTVWDLMSSDWDGDGKNGGVMIDGPFKGFSANFNLNYSGTTTGSNYSPTVNIAAPSNSPGCSISGKSSNGMERGDWWLVAGFLAWLGGIRIRLRRKTRS